MFCPGEDTSISLTFVTVRYGFPFIYLFFFLNLAAESSSSKLIVTFEVDN